ncbi:DUF4212 domain-containing protein [Salicibibacter halophilus]|uniref:DUF4212 domain-containing protein n=1 Tax=Salicibibacter halophilus TaxID=2502791 RepID=A0A514LLD4_9BACI|nr:sodium/substrate symporter small subunit [Salicibibacter halophilus]QDI92679.1 DUF4212 domain-containing protein [Salicibibacter halophilus]
MKIVDKKDAEKYFKLRTIMIFSFLLLALAVSFGVAAFAEFFSQFTFMGMPLHYYMGAQGAIVIFIVLLFLNAVISDRLDKRFGIDDAKNEQIDEGKSFDQ